ncbi:MAG TPA: AmpG family muropeptide MFS transporter [Hyphomicrobiales bacterium]|nr:AmpG family muropeptide MFS transporter [Hyphomicrobiales bacterium]
MPDSHPVTVDQTPLWRQILCNKRLLICVFLGLASGMPLYVLTQMIPGWLRSEQVDLATIGLFALLGLPYNWKFLWAPLMDRYRLPFLGRRRGWMLLTQVALLFSIAGFSGIDPMENISAVMWVVLATAFFSATQDIVIDGYRRELLPDNELGLGNAIHVNAYRISSLVPGSLAFILADHMAWSLVFPVVAGFMVVGIIATLLIPETAHDSEAPTTLRAAIVDPFVEFFTRDSVRSAVLLLAFIVLYKLGDNMAAALQTPFFIDMGYSLTQIGTVAKLSILIASTVGGFVGGIMMLRIPISRALWYFGVVQMLSSLSYAGLTLVPGNIPALALATSFEYFGVGLGTAAFTAFIAQQTSMRFSVTQLALLLSFATIARTFTSAFAGFLIEAMGYFNFFVLCFLLAIPGMVLLIWVAPWSGKKTGAPR